VTADLVATCADRLRPLDIANNAAWWNAQTVASEEHERARADAELALSNALADPDAFAAIREARAGDARDPLTARALAELENLFTPHQVDADLRKEMIDLQTSLEARYARHRGVIDGKPVSENDIMEMLRSSNDSEARRAAWEASKSVGAEIAADVRALARLRNDAARRLGFRDYFAMSVATTDFDEHRLFATLEEVDEVTREPFRALKADLDARLASRFGIDASAVQPWHYDDPFFQVPPQDAGVDLDPVLRGLDIDELTLRTFDGMGLEVRDTLDRSDLEPRDDKVQHAFCLDLDREGDVRVLSNNVPGEVWTETMLHEFGHAIYFEGVSRRLPWLLRTMHMALTEGVAMRCGRLVYEPEWLREIARLPTTKVDELAPRLAAVHRAAILIFARWTLVMTHFERGLYANPDGPHDTRWWDLVERFQLVRRPDGRAEPDWAAKIHVTVAPVYYHNYLYGEMIASQLEQTLGSLVNRPDTGTQLAERLFAPGATLRWDKLIEAATGAPLSPTVLARDIAR
jgi:peptidyl-dipeptidase A